MTTLQAASDAADASVRVIEARLRAELREAEAETKARYKAELDAAHAARAAARRAVIAEEDRCPDHPWTGKRVFRMAPQGRARDRLAPKRIEGVVETARSTTAYPGNTPPYARVTTGHPLVRLLKKDGTPGLQFDRMGRGDGWRLVEDEGAQPDRHNARDGASPPNPEPPK